MSFMRGNPMELTVSAYSLSDDNGDRRSRLAEYFPDFEVDATKANGFWRISLKRPDAIEYYVDPNVRLGLTWWSSIHGPVALSEIPFVADGLSGFQLSLADSWTLYSWSQWLAATLAKGPLPRSITLLHVDDHNDLMTPRIVREVDLWRDCITGAHFHLDDPPTVAAAIASGAVGIGSFIAPLLHFCPCVAVRHLRVSGRYGHREGRYIIDPRFIPDTLLAPGEPRMALDVRPESEDDSVDKVGHSYLITNDLDEWLTGLPDGPMLLHIDMDYFNNRFNRDSDWRHHDWRHDPPVEAALIRVHDVFDSIDEKLADNIVDCTVALSPGFFPGEYWEPCLAAVSLRVKRLPSISCRR